ncbi:MULTISPECIES: tetratricopeptide repeat protein [unclassified Psychrobacter]|uniref:tetratricopeptide repeat protein n=2 Tax=unclassified Psychrobacter TaxID=196806 RepID=UPI003F48C2CE
MTILRQQNSRLLASIAASSLQSKRVLLPTLIMSALVMSACQTAPSTTASNRGSVTTINQTTAVTNAKQPTTSHTNDGYPIEPYIPSSRAPTTYESNDNRQNPLTQSSSAPTQPIPTLPDDNVLVMPLPDVMIEEPPVYDANTPSQSPTLPSHSDLLERARQNSQQSSRQATNNKSDLPAFQNLMQVGTAQLQSGNLTAAESSFTRAQRLAPRSSAVYFYLSQVALKKNQPRKAEAMARRGLTVSQDASRRRSLWQLILRSGQAQNNTRVIREAQQALR